MYKVPVYSPTAKDIEHFVSTIRLLKDKGVWGMPVPQLFYLVDKEVKTLYLKPPYAWMKSPTAMLYHHHNQFTLAAIGWKISPEIDWEADPVREKT
jgi:hypothetical protein